MVEKMEKSQKIRQKLININNIPDDIYGVKFSELDKEKLSYGEYSSLKEHFHLPNGSVKDGKVKLIVNSKGEIEYHFLFQKEILEIPERIGGKKLTPEQLDDLKTGKTVLLNVNNTDIFIKVDKDLNCVSISTGKEIGVPDEMGGYKLTEADKIKLANNEAIGSRIYKGKDGYFISNIKISKDKKEIIFMDIKSIDNIKDIEKYIETLNNKKSTQKVVKEKEIIQKDEIIQKKSNDKTIENTIDVATFKVNPDVEDAIIKKDFEKLNKLKKEGQISTSDINFVKENKGLSKEEKSAALTILGEKVDIEKQKKEFYKAVDEKNNEKIKELSNNGFKPEKEEVDYLVNHKNLNSEEKKDMLSHLNISPDKKNENEIKIGKVEEQFKTEKKNEPTKNAINNNSLRKAERFIHSAFNDM